MNAQQHKPVIGISVGDINGIGVEVIIKTFSDIRVLEMCTPVIFASNKLINFYKKSLPDYPFNYQIIKDFSRINHKQVNVLNVWEEEINVTPGQLTEAGGTYAIKSLVAAVEALKEKHIHGLITGPIHKKNTHSEAFNYTGHTPYLKEMFGAKDVLMFMVSEQFKLGLLSEHVAVKDAHLAVTRENILSKLKLMNESLQKDFGIDRPRIAVLGLNPHAGDEGLIGKEDEEVIKPAIKEAKNQNMIVVGPFPADGFFARNYQQQFDGVLAMYHDQGLIPFKSLVGGSGVNYTAGLPIIRTSPDHGTAFDIAGKNKADAGSFLEAVFMCLDIINHRITYAENRKNPLKKITNVILANAVDESIDIEETE
jgi:4-phospho-D-threonate 3-dehydrogenase / 4-phospho-D-erythronate 3-dehydrogenase